MAQLFLHGEKVNSVFQLLGTNEDDITYSIGYALSKNTDFLSSFISLFYQKVDINDRLKISLQKSELNMGRTDIEIEGDAFYFILEAKRGYWLPNNAQLKLYADRFLEKTGKTCKIIVLAACFPDFAKKTLPSNVNSYPVDYISWRQIYELALTLKTSGKDKIFVSELQTYLGGIVSMQKQESKVKSQDCCKFIFG